MTVTFSVLSLLKLLQNMRYNRRTELYKTNEPNKHFKTFIPLNSVRLCYNHREI